MIVNRYDIKTKTWEMVEEPDEIIPDDIVPDPVPSPEERIAQLEDELRAAKIILGVE